MRKIIIGAALLLSSIVQCQNSGFSVIWKSIDSLELAGKTRSADSLTQIVLNGSRQQQEPLDHIKALIYHFKFYQISHEDSNNYILKTINEAISRLPVPYGNILASYKAEFLEDYYRAQRSAIRKRGIINNPDATDLETWSAQTLGDTITAAFEASLENSGELMRLRSEELELLLNGKSFNRDFRPTAMDLLSARVIDFYLDSPLPSSEAEKKDFDWTNEDLTAETPHFLQVKIPDTPGSHLRVLALFQQMERIHRESGNSEPMVYWTVERLKFVQDKAEVTPERFVGLLERLAEKYEAANIQAFLGYEIANFYYQLADEAEEVEKPEEAEYLIRAVEILEKLVEEYPNTLSSQHARRLKSAITSPALDSRIPEILAVQEPGRILLSYKNIDSLFTKIIRVSKDFPQHLYFRHRDSLVKSLANRYKDSSQVELPGPKDFRTHSTEIVLQGKPAGTYLVFLFGKNGYNNYGFYQVSDLSVFETRFDRKTLYHALHRLTGKSLPKVRLLSRKEDSKNWISRGETNRKGEISLKNSRTHSRETYIFVRDADTLVTGYGQNYYEEEEEASEPPEARVLFFLDRAIYRPGQVVHFKGILLKRKAASTTTVPDEYVPVYVEDPNGNEIEELRFKTNAYGSFSESFTLPETGITGEFAIYSEEDTDADTPFWDEIWDEGEFLETYTYFNVEEYKRPSFEVVFDSIRESFRLQEEVQVTGNASSFMGAPIANARVVYRIKREELVADWWYRHYTGEVVIAADTVMTDEKGDFKIRFLAEAEREEQANPNLIYRYTISASATDISGETREGELSLKLGYRNLLADLQLQEKLNPGDSLKISVKTTNLNDIEVPVTGNLRIYRLKAPTGILKKRLWEAPEFHLISEEEFRRLFPEEPYDSNLDPKEWPKQSLLLETEFESYGTFEEELKNPGSWEEGSYLVELSVKNGKNIAEAKKIFELTNPDSRYLKNQPLRVSQLNTEVRKEGYVEIKIQTAYRDLLMNIVAFDENETFFKRSVSVDGTETLKIPVANVKKEEIRLIVSGVRNNALLEETLRIFLKQEEGYLDISTQTFRNKVAPGIEETWSFRIENQDGQVPNAEILASMYDASLDQFRQSEWETNAGFGNTWLDFPWRHNANIGNIHYLSNNFPSSWRYRHVPLAFDQLQDFGFQFGSPASYAYKRYLEGQKNRKSSGLTGAIKGIVTDEDGLPLPGVTVLIQGTDIGTQTDFDGAFSLDAEKGDILVFSYLGFASRELGVENTYDVFISLNQDANHLEEVVVLGYAAVEDQERSEVAAVLQGRVAGIEVNYATADNVQIRGAGSMEGGTALYIVDGKIVETFDLNSEEILSVEVLKGPEANALYGAAAKIGAVIITTRAGLEDLEQVEARKNLQETAFFLPQLQLGEDGELEFSFTTPEALSSWKFRLLAHTKDWATGSLQKIVKTQKDLNVTPNPPRFLREGDSLVFRAKISNLSSGAMTGNAVLKLFNALTLEPVDHEMGNSEATRAFRMPASQSEVVSWKLYVPEGLPAVTYRILAKAGDFSDGEENLLPVLKNRMLVTESLPFFVRAGETENYTFESLKNNDSESLQHHKFTLEYSSSPAWFALQSLPYLMEYEHECSEQIFSRIFANSVGNRILSSNPQIAQVFQEWKQDSSLVSNLEKNEELKALLLAETPWVLDAESESAQKNRLAGLFDTRKLHRETRENLKKLELLQNASGAFPWFSGGRDNYYITLHIVSGFSRLRSLGIEVDSEEMLGRAIGYLDKNFSEREAAVCNLLDSTEFYSSRATLYYLQARKDFREEYPLAAELSPVIAKILQYQQEHWLQLSLHDKAVLARVLNAFGEKLVAVDILSSLQETAVSSEDYGMYWKENKASWYSSRTPVETQALLIEAFSEIMDKEAAVEEMKIWLLQNKRTNHWATTKATTAASYALLMKGREWLDSSGKTLIRLGGEELATASSGEAEKEAGTGYFQKTWPAGEIEDEFGDIEIGNNSSSPGYGGAYWQYFEDLDKIGAHSEGPLQVEKELYLNRAEGLQQITPDTPVRLGDLVTVRLVVRAAADMEFIHLKDMRASGFEPTDVLSGYRYQDNTAYYQSTRDAATHFFFDELRKGVYVLEYTLRVNNPGTFSNGMTQIQSMYAPEFSGHTRGIWVEIEE